MAFQTPCDLANHTFCVGWDKCVCACHAEGDPLFVQTDLAGFIEAKDEMVRELAALAQVTEPKSEHFAEYACDGCGARLPTDYTCVSPSGRHTPRTLKLRDGDQPLPVVNEEPDVQSQVIADIVERRKIGIQRYGTALQPNNGRNSPQDAYEEALDLVMYWKQWLIEREQLLKRIEELEAEVEELATHDGS